MYHTKEPWHVDIRSGIVAIRPSDKKGGCLDSAEDIIFSKKGKRSGEYWLIEDTHIVNARRVVACVNACAGIPDEKLKGEIVFGIKDTLRKLGEAILKDRELTEKLRASEHECPYETSHGNQIMSYFYFSNLNEPEVPQFDWTYEDYCEENDEEICPKCLEIFNTFIERRKLRRSIRSLRAAITRKALEIARKEL